MNDLQHAVENHRDHHHNDDINDNDNINDTDNDNVMPLLPLVVDALPKAAAIELQSSYATTFVSKCVLNVFIKKSQY